MKAVFPIAAGNGHALQLAKVDTAVGNFCEHAGQAAAGVIGLEINRGLIGIGHHRRAVFMLQYQEAGIIVFHGMDIGRNHMQVEQLGRAAAGNGGNMFAAVLVNMLCAQRRVFRFNQLPVLFIEVLQALLDGHGMTVHFADVFQLYTGIDEQVLADVQVYFTGYAQVAFLQ